jgi:hypothetical protein
MSCVSALAAALLAGQLGTATEACGPALLPPVKGVWVKWGQSSANCRPGFQIYWTTPRYRNVRIVDYWVSWLPETYPASSVVVPHSPAPGANPVAGVNIYTVSVIARTTGGFSAPTTIKTKYVEKPCRPS